MRRLFASVALSASLVIGVAGSAQAGVIVNTVVPLQFLVHVPCAAAGLGEDVLLAGDLHVLASATLDGAGGSHLVVLSQPQGATATGLSTGMIYRAVGVTEQTLNLDAGGLQSTYVNEFGLVGPGTMLFAHAMVHLTLLADGTFAAAISAVSIACR